MINIESVLSLHTDMVERWHQRPVDNPFSGIYQTICQQHQFNFLLWHEEDIARSKTASDREIANVKRAIDRYNQQRNDWIERIDDEIEVALGNRGVTPASDAAIQTETPGSAIDRLSIMSLRVFHLVEQLDRQDVAAEHFEKVQQRIGVCLQQKRHLAAALTSLLEGIFAGAVSHKTYRQFKMYNDPTLNPYLYQTQPVRRVA